VSLIPPDGSITTSKLADNSVTSAKIVDGNVTTADLADSSVTSAKIANGNVSKSKLAADALSPLIQNGSFHGNVSTPGWTLNTGTGDRIYTTHITFNQAFTTFLEFTLVLASLIPIPVRIYAWK